MGLRRPSARMGMDRKAFSSHGGDHLAMDRTTGAGAAATRVFATYRRDLAPDAVS
ncbi:MAG: hypothetical protein ACFCVC_02235 [Acidimicrobiia bacterium]